MKPTLVILAAGMASRYGSMKQVEGFGPSGETIMEYSIYDALRAGFGKIVFIIRREYLQQFRESIGNKLEEQAEVVYVFQELDSYTEGIRYPESRTKPWGTAHAVLCAKEEVKEPFAVINADDFYGKDAFAKAANFLESECSPTVNAIIGYSLVNTLSDHGTVNRGVCEVDKDKNLVGIAERLKVARKGDKVVCDDGQEPRELSLDTPVSMNFWCFDPAIFEYTQHVFREFLSQEASDLKAEFFIPIVADRFIKEGKGVTKVIPTSAQWFGVTYKEDAPSVEESLTNLVKEGEYPQKLWKAGAERSV